MSFQLERALLGCLVLAAGLACSARTSHSVTVSWEAPKSPSGALIVGYNVYRKSKEDSGYARIATRVQGPPYEDTHVTSGHTYFYAVTAVDKTGRESRLSENIQAKIP
jgi:fibronectin type 3 domain-containing protein